ncbi:hypothetical protein [Acidiferrobacter sp. SPIII_3]|uniref:hypothetical protein n=1 Tax=Acidiferrobacter sp. SPIII_3 TaxID=1281578 RepID=UPI0011AB739A|nr:hypothetical protein [Acidiferrobacter sp. SPIII_3]
MPGPQGAHAPDPRLPAELHYQPPAPVPRREHQSAYDEDRCRARKGHTPRTLACLRNFTISLLRLFHVANIKAALRGLAAQADQVLAMLRL